MSPMAGELWTVMYLGHDNELYPTICPLVPKVRTHKFITKHDPRVAQRLRRVRVEVAEVEERET